MLRGIRRNIQSLHISMSCSSKGRLIIYTFCRGYCWGDRLTCFKMEFRVTPGNWVLSLSQLGSTLCCSMLHGLALVYTLRFKHLIQMLFVIQSLQHAPRIFKLQWSLFLFTSIVVFQCSCVCKDVKTTFVCKEVSFFSFFSFSAWSTY